MTKPTPKIGIFPYLHALAACGVFLFVTFSAHAADQSIGGNLGTDRLRITATDGGVIFPETDYSDGSSYRSVWYRSDGFGHSAGTRLTFSDGANQRAYHSGYYSGAAPGPSGLSGAYFTPITNHTSGGQIVNSLSAGGFFEVVQRVSYTPGADTFTIRWSVNNTSGTTLSDLRLYYGGDPVYPNGTHGFGAYDAGTTAIRALPEVGTGSGSIDLRGVTAPHAYMADHYFDVVSAINDGGLTDYVETALESLGIALEWRKDSLAAGDTWEVEAQMTVTLTPYVAPTPTATPTPVPATPTVTPTPNGPTPTGLGAIEGRVLQSASPEREAIGLKDVPMYLESEDNSSNSKTIHGGLFSQMALTDKNGRFRFTKVPRGSYLLRTGREDFEFSPSTLTVSTESPVPDIVAQENSIDHPECRKNVYASKLGAFSKRAGALSNFVLGRIAALNKGSKAEKSAARKLHRAVQKAQREVLSKIKDLPAAGLACPKKVSACRRVSYKSLHRRVLRQLDRVVGLAEQSVNFSSGKSVAFRSKVKGLTDSAVKAAAKLPQSTYRCEEAGA